MAAAELDVDARVADAGQLGRRGLVQQVGRAGVSSGKGAGEAEEEGEVAGEDHAGFVDGPGVQAPVGVVEIAAAQELHGRGVAVAGRHDDVRAEFLSVAEPDADGAVVLDEHGLDLRVVRDLAAQAPVAAFDRLGQAQRTALGDARGEVGVRGELEVEGEHREGGVLLVQDEVERLAQERVLEPCREVGHQDGDGAPDGVEVREERGEHPPAFGAAHQADGFEEGVDGEGLAEGAQMGAEPADRFGVGR